MTTHLKLRRSAFAVSLLAMAAGCGGGSSTTNSQSTSSTNMQQTMGNGSAHAMPSGPFSQAEMQMHERMVAATGANASETWVRKMIEHHRGAVEMSQVLINGGGDPGFVQIARTGAEMQQREIGQLERMLAGGIAGGSGEANPYGPVERSMHEQMMAATGSNLSESWARKMVAHHQGAVDMSQVLIRQGGNPQVLAMARTVAEVQRREIAHLEAMLRGEPMPVASAATAPAAPGARSTPATEPRESPRAVPTRTAREPSSATSARRPAERDQAAPRPAPPAAPAPPCAPEHRAAGHC